MVIRVTHTECFALGVGFLCIGAPRLTAKLAAYADQPPEAAQSNSRGRQPPLPDASSMEPA
jgi:hypothetical protein